MLAGVGIDHFKRQHLPRGDRLERPRPRRCAVAARGALGIGIGSYLEGYKASAAPSISQIWATCSRPNRVSAPPRAAISRMLQPGRSRPGAGSPEAAGSHSIGWNRPRTGCYTRRPGRPETRGNSRLRRGAAAPSPRRRLRSRGRRPGPGAGPGEMVVFVDRGQVTPVGREASEATKASKGKVRRPGRRESRKGPDGGARSGRNGRRA